MATRRLLLFGLLMAIALAAAMRVTGRGPMLTTLVLSQGVNGYNGATDTWIDSLQPDTNYGNEDQMTVVAGSGANLLIRFDLGPLPPGAVIQGAVLQIDAVQRSGTGAISVATYPLRRSWSEDQATWLRPLSGGYWGIPGAGSTEVDRALVPEDITMIDSVGSRHEWDVTAAAQAWLASPSTNGGLVLIAADGAGSVYSFYTSETTRIDLRPKLVISYSALPATATPTASVTPTSTPPAPSATPTTMPAPEVTSTPTATATAAILQTATATATPSGLAVDMAIPVQCDQVYAGDTREWPARVSNYPSCRSNWPETGPEAIYRLVLSETSNLSAQITHVAALDLDLFLVEESIPERCLAGEDTALAYSRLAPGGYLLVVDGYEGSAGPFHLQISCDVHLSTIGYLPLYLRGF